jgi:hypothetical protein
LSRTRLPRSRRVCLDSLQFAGHLVQSTEHEQRLDGSRAGCCTAPAKQLQVTMNRPHRDSSVAEPIPNPRAVAAVLPSGVTSPGAGPFAPGAHPCMLMLQEGSRRIHPGANQAVYTFLLTGSF